MITLRGNLAEGRVGLLHDVDLEPDLLQLSLQPDGRLLVRLPADADGEVDGNRRLAETRLRHQGLGFLDVILVRRNRGVVAGSQAWNGTLHFGTIAEQRHSE